MANLLKKIIETNYELTIEDKKQIMNKIEKLESQLKTAEEELLQCGMILKYDDYRKNFTYNQVKEFYNQDIAIINDAKSKLKYYNKLKHTMFGYPANMVEPDYLEKYLKKIDIQLPFLNNCGEPYSIENHGNYIMDSKKVEFDIVNLICGNLDLPIEKYIGYVTSGGTEGNFFGLKNGIEMFPDGIVYYSSDAHYSVQKFLKICRFEDSSIAIKSDEFGRIDAAELLNYIESNWKEKRKPAILMLTFGTTVYGAIDDVEYICNYLNKSNIPYYVHIDAAFFGGIPKNQIEAPKINKLSNINIDSISVSLHKYIGCSLANGVVIYKKNQENSDFISYIGQRDTTVLGSRSILPYSTYYHLCEFFNRSSDNMYIENVNYFENLLIKNNISYKKNDNSNIFVFKNISNKNIKKYQLATFEELYSHVIIMPFHSKKSIDNLIRDFKKNS